jgi:ribosomal-protein-alanine N-acetyltransferase
MFGPLIRGKLVTLRPPPPEIVPLWIQWVSDLEVTRFIVRRNVPALHEEEDWYKRAAEDRNGVIWAIEVEGTVAGTTGIHQIDWLNGHATTGTVIGEKRFWRRGVASETMALRTRFAFRELNLHKLKSGAFEENEPSKRALMKTGYREIGIHREEFFREGRWHDLWLCELLREDWERAHAGDV